MLADARKKLKYLVSLGAYGGVQLCKGYLFAEGEGYTLCFVVCFAINNARYGKQGFSNVCLAVRAHHAVYGYGDGIHLLWWCDGKVAQTQRIGDNAEAT